MSYFDTSAKNNMGVNEGFNYLCEEAYKKVISSKEDDTSSKNFKINKQNTHNKKKNCISWLSCG